MIHLGIGVFSLENQKRIRESNHFSLSYVAHVQIGGLFFQGTCARGNIGLY